jgi:hypothetical protein
MPDSALAERPNWLCSRLVRSANQRLGSPDADMLRYRRRRPKSLTVKCLLRWCWDRWLRVWRSPKRRRPRAADRAGSQTALTPAASLGPSSPSVLNAGSPAFVDHWSVDGAFRTSPGAGWPRPRRSRRRRKRRWPAVRNQSAQGRRRDFADRLCEADRAPVAHIPPGQRPRGACTGTRWHCTRGPRSLAHMRLT